MADPDTEIMALLRKARRINPAVFDEAVKAYTERGPSAIAPTKEAGAPKRIQPINYALLLADVENAKEVMSENAKLKELAENGCTWGNDGKVTGTWLSVPTIKTHLRTARQLYKDDPEFQASVEFYRWAFDELKIGSHYKKTDE